MEPSDTPCQRLRLRLSALQGERTTWIPHWRDLAENVRPRSFRYLTADTNKGTKKNTSIINGTPTLALRTLAAGMMAGITSPSRPWLRLTTQDPSLAEMETVKQWLADAEKRIFEACAKSNIYNGLHDVYFDLGLFGVSALHVEEDTEDLLRAYVFPIGQYCLASSPRQAIDTVYREFQMTVRQVVKKFGLERCSESLKAQYQNKAFEAWVRVLHVIEPNEDFSPGRLGPKGKKFVSLWLEADSGEEKFLREEGFYEFPVMCPRWATTGEDVYGSSPGMDALGDCRALQLLEKRKAQVVDRIVTPPMKGPSSLQSTRTSLLPGDTTYVDALAPNQTFSPAYEINPQAIAVIGNEIATKERLINKAFYADLWLLLAESDGQMTAREVVERREEKLLQLGTVLERLQDELLDPMIDRIFGILTRAGHLPPPPEELAGADLKVEYISIMAQAQKLLGTTAVERLTSFVGNLVAVKPEVLDKLDLDQTVDEYAAMLGVPPSMVRPDEIVAQLRDARAQAAQQQQAVAAAQQASVAAKNLSQADTEGNNALTTMLKGYGVQ